MLIWLAQNELVREKPKETDEYYYFVRILLIWLAQNELVREEPKETDEYYYFVDLAGSEQANQGGAKGNRQKEASFINSESKLSFEKVYELAQVMETADHDARELQGPPTTDINKLNKSTSAAARYFPSTNTRQTNHRNSQSNCFCCGRKHSQLNANFDNRSADSIRKLSTLKSLLLQAQAGLEQKEISTKLITYHCPVRIR